MKYEMRVQCCKCQDDITPSTWCYMSPTLFQSLDFFIQSPLVEVRFTRSKLPKKPSDYILDIMDSEKIQRECARVGPALFNFEKRMHEALKSMDKFPELFFNGKTCLYCGIVGCTSLHLHMKLLTLINRPDMWIALEGGVRVSLPLVSRRAWYDASYTADDEDDQNCAVSFIVRLDKEPLVVYSRQLDYNSTWPQQKPLSIQSVDQCLLKEKLFGDSTNRIVPSLLQSALGSMVKNGLHVPDLLFDHPYQKFNLMSHIICNLKL